MAGEMTFVAANPELERRAKAAFDEVVDLPGELREAAIMRACGEDAALRKRVDSLIAAHDNAENFLDPPPALFGFDLESATDAADAASAHPSSADDDPLIGQRIARHRVLRRLGAGGMGVVYLAEQDQPRRTVALKVMRAGLANRPMLRRFEHEAEVLGHLKHPGIAQVFEAGTFDVGHGAQPYFAMEFIDGPTITAFAQSHALDVRARLELLAQVCDAIHHAHQKGVVHRDLKPDNILVAGGSDGLKPACRSGFGPKVLDFGVARLTDSDFAVTTLKTDIGQIVGTLPYMSPEQVAADPSQVDVRSDVYALGVITYELLTGSVPFDVRHKSMAEAARIIVDHEPPPLTSFDRIFRGDVSTIVAKALEKDKTRRYQSASDLGEDIRRYLRHEPISARPATTMYQLRKFARRNKTLVAGAVGIVLMLTLGVIGTSIGLVQARESARIAKKQEIAAEASAVEAGKQRAAAEQVSRFLQQMLASINPSIAQGRDTALLREILANAAQRVDRELADHSDIAATLHGVIGRTYASIAEYPQAIDHLRLALDVQRKLTGDNSAATVSAEGDLGRALLSADRFVEAQPLLEHALATSRELGDGDDLAVARALNDLGNQRRRSGDYENAENMLRQAQDILSGLLAPDDPARLRATNDLANVLLTRRKFTEARPLFEFVLEARMQRASPDSPELALAESNVARTLQYLNQTEAAKEHMRKALAIYRKVLPPGHNTLASALLTMANIHFKRREYDDAEVVLNEALETNRKAYGPESSAVATIIASQSTLAESRRDPQEAERLCLIALDMRRKSLPADHPDIAASLRQLAGLRGAQNRDDDARLLLQQALEILRIHGASDYDACETIVNLATYEFQHGDLGEAVRLTREALGIMTPLLGEDHPSVLTTRGRVARFLEAQGKHGEALPLHQDVLERMRRLPKYEPGEIAAAVDRVGSTLLLLNRAAEAEPLLREGLEIRTRELGEDHFATGMSLIHLGRCLTAQSRFAEAEGPLLKGESIWAAQGATQPGTREARNGLAELYRAWGRPNDAAAWERTLAGGRGGTKTASPSATRPSL